MGVMVVTCVPASDGIAVAPCGTVDNVALVPLVRDLGGAPLDYSELGAMFAYTFSIVLAAFVIGAVVGSVVRLLKSA